MSIDRTQPPDVTWHIKGLSPDPDLPLTMPTAPGHLVYVARGVGGEVLYVGVTSNFYVRMANHSNRSPWWSAAHTLALLPCQTRLAANNLERRTIRDLRPIFNWENREVD